MSGNKKGEWEKRKIIETKKRWEEILEPNKRLIRKKQEKRRCICIHRRWNKEQC